MVRSSKPQTSMLDSIDWLKAVMTLLVGAYGMLCVFTPGVYRFLDGADLVIHEFGHPFFSMFGMFMGILGGSMMQLLVPAACAVYFFYSRQRFSAFVVLFWVGQNCFNVARYMKDAQLMDLPLVGGEDVIHDWNWLFNKMHLLEQCYVIGNFTYAVGVGFVLVSIGGMVYYSLHHGDTKSFIE